MNSAINSDDMPHVNSVVSAKDIVNDPDVTRLTTNSDDWITKGLSWTEAISKHKRDPLFTDY
jgi:hypothetical protein